MHYELSNEYLVDWPIWGPTGGVNDSEPALPPLLHTDVKAWARNFNQGYSHQTGWSSAEVAAAHHREGLRLEAAIRTAIWPDAHSVTLRYWETQHE